MKIKVIINSTSRNGRKDTLESSICRKFADSLVSVERTAFAGHAYHLARQAVQDRTDIVVAAGGDGTIHEILNAILGSEVALGIIPNGTANDLASYFGITNDTNRACDIILDHYQHPVDVIKINDKYMVTGGGIGLPCRIAKIANALRRQKAINKILGLVFSGNLYFIAALWAVASTTGKQNILNIRSDNKSLTVDTLSLTICNQPFLGKKFLASPGAINDDGMFDVCLIENTKNRPEALSVITKASSGKHVTLPSVSTWRSKEMSIDAEMPFQIFADGEVFEETTHAEIQIIPRALNVIIPKTPGL